MSQGWTLHRVEQKPPAPSRPRPAPPGLAIAALTLACVALLQCLRLDLWPAAFGQMDRYDRLLIGALALTVLGITAAWWLARTVKRMRWASWSWWIAAAPAILAAGAVLALLTPSPATEDAQHEFESFAPETVLDE